MRYFAILKDSLREALDAKLLIVLLVLSTAVIGIVACFSFEALTAEETMQMFFDKSPFEPSQIVLAVNSHKPEKLLKVEDGNLFGGGGGPMIRTRLEYQLVRVNQIRGDTDSPEGDYEVFISQSNWLNGNPPPAGLGKEDGAIKAVRDIFQDAEDLGFVQIGEVEFDGRQVENTPKRYRVLLKGTSRTHRIWATQLYFCTYKWPGPPHPLGFLVYDLAQQVIKFGSWVAVLAAVIITSFFIPSMLRKGAVDLLLAKPIHRWALLVYKYLGGLTFVFLINAYSILGIWLVIGIRSGLWANAALLLIFSLTFFFATLYAISTFVGVVTRNALVSIVVTIVAWTAFALIGMFHNGMEVITKMENLAEKHNHPIPADQRWGDGNLAMTSRVLHATTPHTEDLNKLNDILIFTSFMTGDPTDIPKFDSSGVSWWTSLLISTVWIAIFVGLAAAWFTYKDY
jgi:ABC-type transport system involved in multi-copper enzyme maturation permease subunit